MSYGVNAPFGLQPRMHQNGSTWNGQTTAYPLASKYNEDLKTGDPVNVAVVNNGGTGNYIASVVKAGAGSDTPFATNNPIAGVFMGVKYLTNDSGSTQIAYPMWKKGTETFQNTPAVALICDDTSVLYDVQADATSIPDGIPQDALFQNGQVVFTNLGNSQSGQSGVTIGNLTTDASAQLKMHGFTANPLNKPDVPFNNVLVSINNNFYGNKTAGAIYGGTQLSKNINITGAQINAMYTAATQINLVPAPGADSFIYVTSLSITQATVTASAFTLGGNVGLRYGNQGNGFDPIATTIKASGELPPAIFTGSGFGPFVFGQLIPSVNSIPAILNLGIYLTNDTVNFATGTDSYVVDITYAIVKVIS